VPIPKSFGIGTLAFVSSGLLIRSVHSQWLRTSRAGH
jgi:hypothetical protein